MGRFTTAFASSCWDRAVNLFKLAFGSAGDARQPALKGRFTEEFVATLQIVTLGQSYVGYMSCETSSTCAVRLSPYINGRASFKNRNFLSSSSELEGEASQLAEEFED